MLGLPERSQREKKVLDWQHALGTKVACTIVVVPPNAVYSSVSGVFWQHGSCITSISSSGASPSGWIRYWYNHVQACQPCQPCQPSRIIGDYSDETSASGTATALEASETRQGLERRQHEANDTHRPCPRFALSPYLGDNFRPRLKAQQRRMDLPMDMPTVYATSRPPAVKVHGLGTAIMLTRPVVRCASGIDNVFCLLEQHTQPLETFLSPSTSNIKRRLQYRVACDSSDRGRAHVATLEASKWTSFR